MATEDNPPLTHLPTYLAHSPLRSVVLPPKAARLSFRFCPAALKAIFQITPHFVSFQRTHHLTICIFFPFLFLFSHSSLPSRLNNTRYPPPSLIPSTHPQLPTLDPHSDDTPIAINNGSFIIHFIATLRPLITFLPSLGASRTSACFGISPSFLLAFSLALFHSLTNESCCHEGSPNHSKSLPEHEPVVTTVADTNTKKI